MNRRERRRAAVKKTKSPFDGKSMITLHTEPNETNQAQLAVLLTALAYSFTVSKSLEGNVPGFAWPVHVSIDFGGIAMCGTVEPSDGVSGEQIIKLTMH